MVRPEVVRRRLERLSDLADLRMAGEPLLGQSLQKGDRLFVRDQPLFAELIKRHLFDSTDFLPYKRRIPAGRRQAWIGM